MPNKVYFLHSALVISRKTLRKTIHLISDRILGLEKLGFVKLAFVMFSNMLLSIDNFSFRHLSLLANLFKHKFAYYLLV